MKILYESLTTRTQTEKTQIIERHNKNRKVEQIKVREEVYVKPTKTYPKTKERYWGPYTVYRLLKNGTVKVKNKNNKKLKYHINSLKLGNVSDASSSEEKQQGISK